MPASVSPPPSRRRPRGDIESDEEADSLRGSQRSSPAASNGKRARTNGYQSDEDEDEDDGSTAPAVQPTNGFHNGQGNIYDDDEEEDGNGDPDTYQPGALIRVKLTNFITYESAEFFPGPSLNMVIGPNGTGKSSLVCAICIGLGWSAKHLGRASELGEFVKHNMSEAQIEIELQKRPNEDRNHVIRVRILRETNGREWYLDGKKTSHKAIQELTASYSIQVDNLCQFLPQDKVAEFAGLSPVDLLLQTQRAAAPAEMLQMHEQLKARRKKQKSLEHEQAGHKEQLTNLEARQANLHAEVLRLQERQEVQKDLRVLKCSRPFLEYRIALADHLRFKEAKIEAQDRYSQLKEEAKPVLRIRDAKEDYAKRITLAIRGREAALTAAERAADQKLKAIEDINGEIETNEKEEQAARDENTERRKQLKVYERRINDLEAQLKHPIVFDGPTLNKNIREKEVEHQNISSKLRTSRERGAEIKQSGKAAKEKIDRTNQELAAFDTQEGQQLNNLYRTSRPTAEAWKWVQEHLEEFEKEVYGPPMISCSIKDPRYTMAVESMLGKNDFLTITAQTKNDHKKLQNQVFGTLKLADVSLRLANDNLQSRVQGSQMSPSALQDIGMDHLAIDLIDGPLAVLSMLCDSKSLHRAGVTLNEIDETQYHLLAASQLGKWATKSSSYSVARRTEYGSGAVSTTTKSLRPAAFWVDQPVDTSARRQIEDRLRVAQEEFDKLKTESLSLRPEITNLEKEQKELNETIRELKKEKGDLQTAYNKWKAIPDKISVEKEALESRKAQNNEFTNQMKAFQNKFDLAVGRKTKYALEHKDLVEKIRDCQDELLEARVRLIEAQSDVEGLTARNEDIVKQLDDERARKEHAEEQSKQVLLIAKEAKKVCEEILADPENEPHRAEFVQPPPGLTLESLDAEIVTAEAKLDYMQTDNPNAIRQYEDRQKLVDKLRETVETTEGELEKLERRITRVRGEWEPKLDALIAEISDAFSHNFEQIGCAGSVSVHKDDDFELWAIQIKVKFRAGEDLQILDAHRQSGGERSVSTIFYLMSLQRLARAPFRVVDEINQGMDPRNERMVHERMVEIACRENTSQYFLITPKLLTNLRYDKRMRVLCIASGEFMPDDYKKLDVSKIIGIRQAIIAAQ